MTTLPITTQDSARNTHGGSPIGSVTASQLQDLLSDGQELALMDVRDAGVFSAGHLFWAASLPLNKLEYLADTLVPRRATRMVLVDDEGADNGMACTAALRLTGWGYTNILVLQGGLSAWKAAGHQVFSGVYVPSKAFGEFVEHECDTPRISAQTLNEWKKQGKDILMLDSRPFEEFTLYSLPGGASCPGAELVHRAFGLVERPDTTVVVNCAGRTRGIIGAQSLINAGLPNPVVCVENGTAGWHLSGQSMSHGQTEVAAPPSPTSLQKALAAGQRVADRFGVKEIDASQFKSLREEPGRTVYVFDVRTPEEYRAGHLAISRSAPGGQLVQSTDHYVGVRNSRLILVDDNGIRARMTASWLIQMGWTDVLVLKDGLHSTGEPLIHGAEQQKTLGDEHLAQVDWVSVFELKELLEGDDVVVVDLETSLQYKAGHIPGSWWAVRSRMKACMAKLPAHRLVVLTSSDGQFAAMAAADVQSVSTRPVRVLHGGTKAWSAVGLRLSTGLAQMTTGNDDIWYSPYDYEDRKASMNAYLQWEVDLLEQIKAEQAIRFNCAPAANQAST